MSSLYISASGMINQQINVDMISNNLANVNTSGFKKSEISFRELAYKDIATNKSQTNQVGLGSSVNSVGKIFTQGTIKETGNALDLAIEGDGFFKILMPDGTFAYTRDGSFQFDALGNLVTKNGYKVAPGITIAGDFSDISVSENGIISVTEIDVNGVETIRVAGTITLSRFTNPAGLESIAGNLYKETVASGLAQDNPADGSTGKIKQGYLEMGNINVIEEMVNLIAAQRAYEINSKAIQASDDMMGMANSIRK